MAITIQTFRFPCLSFFAEHAYAKYLLESKVRPTLVSSMAHGDIDGPSLLTGERASVHLDQHAGLGHTIPRLRLAALAYADAGFQLPEIRPMVL